MSDPHNDPTRDAADPTDRRRVFGRPDALTWSLVGLIGIAVALGLFAFSHISSDQKVVYNRPPAATMKEPVPPTVPANPGNPDPSQKP
jgi:hypothetical protein